MIKYHVKPNIIIAQKMNNNNSSSLPFHPKPQGLTEPLELKFKRLSEAQPAAKMSNVQSYYELYRGSRYCMTFMIKVLI